MAKTAHADQPETTSEAEVKGKKAKPAKASAPAVGDADKPKRGLNAKLAVAPPLAAVVGVTEAPRTEVVALIWDYIRKNGLQDPEDKRTIVADEKLKAVFGKDRVTMFEMQKLLSPHLKAA